MMKYHIGLGSNIGERQKNLERAISMLEKNGVQIGRKSSIYETFPKGNTEQPWFLNQVLEIQTELEPLALLKIVKEVEKNMGRISSIPKGPRCIDIDILLAEDRVIRVVELIIPHPEMTKRNFVLVPLKEIAFEILHPVLRQKIGDLWRKSNDSAIVRPYVQTHKKSPY
jgi:2-amino-4-hydroxy-6-hydroxymethyldihydropteridine diphosphokinase